MTDEIMVFSGDSNPFAAYCMADVKLSVAKHGRIVFPFIEKPSGVIDTPLDWIVDNKPSSADRRPMIARHLNSHPRSPRRA